MSKFEDALLTILKHEGGYANHPNDPGGATNYGVSLRYLLTLGDVDGDGYLEGDFDGDGDVDADDIKRMTAANAADIYREQWWDRYQYGRINAQSLATKVLDMAVNMGAGRAHRLLQTALTMCGKDVVVDGKLGPGTCEAVNKCAEMPLLIMLRAVCAQFYMRLHKSNPDKYGPFIKGWLHRAYDRA